MWIFNKQNRALIFRKDKSLNAFERAVKYTELSCFYIKHASKI